MEVDEDFLGLMIVHPLLDGTEVLDDDGLITDLEKFGLQLTRVLVGTLDVGLLGLTN